MASLLREQLISACLDLLLKEKEEEQSPDRRPLFVTLTGGSFFQCCGLTKLRLPKSVSFGGRPAVKSVALGEAHGVACLYTSGVAIGWGSGAAAGLGKAHHQLLRPQATIIESLRGIPITMVAAGSNHSLFLGAEGGLFVSGDGAALGVGRGHGRQHSPVAPAFFSAPPFARTTLLQALADLLPPSNDPASDSMEGNENIPFSPGASFTGLASPPLRKEKGGGPSTPAGSGLFCSPASSVNEGPYSKQRRATASAALAGSTPASSFNLTPLLLKNPITPLSAVSSAALLPRASFSYSKASAPASIGFVGSAQTPSLNAANGASAAGSSVSGSIARPPVFLRIGSISASTSGDAPWLGIDESALLDLPNESLPDELRDFLSGKKSDGQGKASRGEIIYRLHEFFSQRLRQDYSHSSLSSSAPASSATGAETSRSDGAEGLGGGGAGAGGRQRRSSMPELLSVSTDLAGGASVGSPSASASSSSSTASSSSLFTRSPPSSAAAAALASASALSPKNAASSILLAGPSPAFRPSVSTTKARSQMQMQMRSESARSAVAAPSENTESLLAAAAPRLAPSAVGRVDEAEDEAGDDVDGGDNDELLLPVFEQPPERTEFLVGVAAGGATSFAWSESGKCWAWGASAWGQTGTGVSTGDVFTPTLVGELAQEKVVQVAAGPHHTLFLSSEGHLWACGNGTFGRLGCGTDERDRSYPVRVRGGDLGSSRVVHAAAGHRHSIVVTAEGKVLAFGDNANLALGVPPLEDLAANAAHSSSAVASSRYSSGAPSPVPPRSAASGGSVPSTPNPSTALNQLPSFPVTEESFGLLRDGYVKLGISHSQEQPHSYPHRRHQPTEVKLPAEAIHVAAGGACSFAVTSDGALYCWGTERNHLLSSIDPQKVLRAAATHGEAAAADLLGAFQLSSAAANSGPSTSPQHGPSTVAVPVPTKVSPLLDFVLPTPSKDALPATAAAAAELKILTATVGNNALVCQAILPVSGETPEEEKPRRLPLCPVLQATKDAKATAEEQSLPSLDHPAIVILPPESSSEGALAGNFIVGFAEWASDTGTIAPLSSFAAKKKKGVAEVGPPPAPTIGAPPAPTSQASSSSSVAPPPMLPSTSSTGAGAGGTAGIRKIRQVAESSVDERDLALVIGADEDGQELSSPPYSSAPRSASGGAAGRARRVTVVKPPAAAAAAAAAPPPPPPPPPPASKVSPTASPTMTTMTPHTAAAEADVVLPPSPDMPAASHHHHAHRPQVHLSQSQHHLRQPREIQEVAVVGRRSKGFLGSLLSANCCGTGSVQQQQGSNDWK